MSNFIHGCGRLCALAMIVSCTSPLGLGHDLPHDRILPEQTTWNCFSAVGHQADSATSHSQNHGQENSENATLFTTVLGNQVWLSELPLPSPTANYLHAWQTFTSQAAQVLESIIRPLGQIQLPVNSARSNSTCDLVIALPETGTAPRPKAKGIRGHDNILAHALKLIEARIADESPRVRLEAIVAAAKVKSPDAIRVALKALDKPMDSFLDRALWLGVHATAPQWRPLLKADEMFNPK